MNKNFYDMVKYWTISDYKTPGIKAEVILDMLISEFIEDLLRFRFQKEDVTLLAKEFPVDINKGELNAKVDYLVCVDKKKLVLVELKTSNESYGKLQKERMENVEKDGVAKLIEFYKDIAKNSSEEKYRYSLEMYKRNLYKDGLKEKYFSEVDHMYILITDSDEITDKKLVLTDCCKGGCHYSEFVNFVRRYHRELWDMVSGILLPCAHRFDGIDGVKRDALEKLQGLEQGEKFFELIFFMCELNYRARKIGLLSIEEAVIPPKLALNEFVFQAREELLNGTYADELTESLTNQYWANNWQGENALIGYMIILSFVNLGNKNSSEFEQLLLSCLNAESAEMFQKYKTAKQREISFM